jgi:hypothetical protein
MGAIVSKIEFDHSMHGRYQWKNHAEKTHCKES